MCALHERFFRRVRSVAKLRSSFRSGRLASSSICCLVSSLRLGTVRSGQCGRYAGFVVGRCFLLPCVLWPFMYATLARLATDKLFNRMTRTFVDGQAKFGPAGFWQASLFPKHPPRQWRRSHLNNLEGPASRVGHSRTGSNTKMEILWRSFGRSDFRMLNGVTRRRSR
jgi:hypothetical protein